MKYIGTYDDSEYGRIPLYVDTADFDNVTEKECWNKIVENGGNVNGTHDEDRKEF